jgi:hypothetical protein
MEVLITNGGTHYQFANSAYAQVPIRCLYDIDIQIYIDIVVLKLLWDPFPVLWLRESIHFVSINNNRQVFK